MFMRFLGVRYCKEIVLICKDNWFLKFEFFFLLFVNIMLILKIESNMILNIIGKIEIKFKFDVERRFNVCFWSI